MTLYKTALRMAHDVTFSQRRRWSTTFYVEAANATAAASAIAVAWNATLKNGCDTRVFAYEVYATDQLPGTEDFAVVGIPASQQRGTIDAGASEAYLLKAAIAVELLVPNSRPSRKFWRPGLRETQVVNGVSVEANTASLVRTAFTNFLTTMGSALKDPDGQTFSGVGKLTLTTRQFGREAGSNLPEPPPVG